MNLSRNCIELIKTFLRRCEFIDFFYSNECYVVFDETEAAFSLNVAMLTTDFVHFEPFGLPFLVT